MERLRIALLLLIACVCSASTKSGFTCKEAERNALLKLKHSFNDTKYILGSWVGEDCCNWKGVGCDNATGHVISLDLRADLEYAFYLEAEEVNPALLELKYLRYLDLSGIYFNCSRIPEFLGSMGQLQYLNLSNAWFGGKVPHNLGNLTKLVVLDLSSGDFSLETDNLKWAFKLKNLQHLDLSGIDLSQALDSLHILHNLPSLSVLNLDHCGLGNSHLVKRNSTVSSIPLQHLSLSYNLFSGRIPNFIQNLSSIRFLDLSSNHLSSSIPSWLANKRDLQFISLSNNHLNLIDVGIMHTIASLCSLKYLDFSNNQLQEELTESYANFSRCRRNNLEYLNLQNNNISGLLPSFIGSLSSLQHLDLSHNKLKTTHPSLGELSSLVYLDLSHNNLSGVMDQVSFANLSSLLSLDLSENSLTLVLPLDWLPPFQLKSFLISSCKLNTPFPQWLENQTTIVDLDLSDTGIFGPLPDNISNTMPSLGSLRLARNDINGSIPPSLCELLNLDMLDLQKNRLSGMIPECWERYLMLAIVELSSNRLSGPIPHSLTSAIGLEVLSLSNNLLEGDLPLSLGNCQDLMVLDVSKNNLQGKIPPWTGDTLPFLQIFILRENKFEGTIPPHVCSILTLQIIDIASNNLSGTIPQCFGHFDGMGSIQDLSDFTISPPRPAVSSFAPAPAPFAFAGAPTMDPDEWSAVQVIKGEEREYTTVLHRLVNMDLSCNNLVGVVPEKITSLSLLISLNLSHNHLKGPIPKEIGKMKSLEALDLSFNNLSGPIPESISSLYSLSKMNLSFNSLQGQIPTGNQLQTLDDPSIYMGNLGLCGDPLPQCLRDGIAHPPTSVLLEDEEEDNKHEKMWFYLIIMLGFATGFWGVIGILVVKRRWRHFFFQLAEDLADWMLVKLVVGIAQAKGGR